MCVGKKAAGKRINIGGKLVLSGSFLISIFEKLGFFVTVLGALHITKKVFAKGGLNLTGSSISTERSKLLFQITKLQKKVI